MGLLGLERCLFMVDVMTLPVAVIMGRHRLRSNTRISQLKWNIIPVVWLYRDRRIQYGVSDRTAFLTVTD
jgi:hypothetical protein